MDKKIIVYGGRMSKLERAFEVWWFQEGSGMAPQKDEDAEQHVKRIARLAWLNGDYKKVTK